MDKIQKEIDEIKIKITEIENKFNFVKDYELITALLNKLNIDCIEISNKEMTEDNMYTVTRKENYVIIKRLQK